jgi:hypothetical protein
MIVADEDDVDPRKTFDGEAGVRDSVQPEHAGADGVEQDPVSQDAQVRRLNQSRRVADPEHLNPLEHRFCRRRIWLRLETGGPVLFLGSQFPGDPDLVPQRIAGRVASIVKAGAGEVIGGWQWPRGASLQRHRRRRESERQLKASHLLELPERCRWTDHDVASARMSRFSSTIA